MLALLDRVWETLKLAAAPGASGAAGWSAVWQQLGFPRGLEEAESGPGSRVKAPARNWRRPWPLKPRPGNFWTG